MTSERSRTGARLYLHDRAGRESRAPVRPGIARCHGGCRPTAARHRPPGRTGGAISTPRRRRAAPIPGLGPRGAGGLDARRRSSTSSAGRATRAGFPPRASRARQARALEGADPRPTRPASRTLAPPARRRTGRPTSTPTTASSRTSSSPGMNSVHGDLRSQRHPARRQRARDRLGRRARGLPRSRSSGASALRDVQGEKDILGNVYGGRDRPLTPRSFRRSAHRRVGAYAVQIDWADGHNDGIYSFEALRRIGDEPGCVYRPTPPPLGRGQRSFDGGGGRRGPSSGFRRST